MQFEHDDEGVLRGEEARTQFIQGAFVDNLRA